MFTGIVQKLARVDHVAREGTLLRLALALDELGHGLQLGASVAVNGTCLTVTSIGNTVTFDVIAETLSTTNLGQLARGDLVNVERSFTVGDEVGGHILSGHVSGVVEVVQIDEGPERRDLHFSVPPRWMKYLQHKGFVALDGASITIARVDAQAHRFVVCLIPETIARTTLGQARVGSLVNLEVDAQTQSVVDTVERVLAERFPNTREIE